MKIVRILSILLIMAVVVAGCNKKEEPQPTPEELQLDKLAGTWTLGSGAVTLDGQDRSADWAGFTVTFTTGKSYSTSNSFDENVWPTGGTWDFQGTSGAGLENIVRSDGITIALSNFSESAATLTFDYLISRPLKNGKVESIEGTWVFQMSK